MKKLIAGTLFLVVIFFNLVILKPTADGDIKSDLKVPDITFSYSGEEIYDNFFLKLNPEIIPTYKKNMLWDYPYPIIYTAFLLLMGQILFSKGLFMKIFSAAAVAAFIFDYAENLTQLYLLNQLPEVHTSLGTMMGVFTSIKWTTVVFALVSVLVALIKSAIAKFSLF